MFVVGPGVTSVPRIVIFEERTREGRFVHTYLTK